MSRTWRQKGKWAFWASEKLEAEILPRGVLLSLPWRSMWPNRWWIQLENQESPSMYFLLICLFFIDDDINFTNKKVLRHNRKASHMLLELFFALPSGTLEAKGSYAKIRCMCSWLTWLPYLNSFKSHGKIIQEMNLTLQVCVGGSSFNQYIVNLIMQEAVTQLHML